MNRKPISPDFEQIPAVFHQYLRKDSVYDSSCSPDARVYYIDLDDGYFLKQAPKGTLHKEAVMTRYLHTKGLSAEVLAYESFQRDWLLTHRLRGEDCLSLMYIQKPVHLCDITASLLRMLHDTPCADCPIQDLNAQRIVTAQNHYEAGQYDQTLFPDNWGYACAEDAISVIRRDGKYLNSGTLLHGDYCLPNIILDNWKLSGFIDVGAGGVGDRHIDLFWGIWSLNFNLKTDRYRSRFLDVYGRDQINEDIFPLIAALEVFL